MKRIVSLVLAVSLTCSFAAVAGNTGGQISKGISRGIENVIASPGEIIHYTIADTSEYSIVGLITGPVKGTIFMVSRMASGLADVATLGLLPAESDPYSALCVKPINLERACCKAPAAPCAPCQPMK